MNVFKEGEWETDDTGDKLAKELFLGQKKKDKSLKKTLTNVTQNAKRIKEKGKKKKQMLQFKDNNESNNAPALKNEANNKKRKSSSIAIDETMIKKWKAESNKQAEVDQGANSLKRNSNRKKTKFTDQSDLKSEKKNTVTNKVGNLKIISKKGKLESKEKSDRLDRKKKLNRSNSGIDSKIVGDVMTKSQKRRLKQKDKLLNGQKNLPNLEQTDGKQSSSASVNFSGEIVDKKSSTDLKVSKKMYKSKLKIDRLQTLLMNKQQDTLKNNGNLVESTSLRDRMMARLKSSRFRYLNEQMYNSESSSSKKYFKEDPDAFVAYHEGYKLQVNQWPLNPLDTMIASVKRLPKDYVIADFGCGEARLAESVPHTVHSLDLVAINDKVTACDMARTSLLTGRIDVVVFCLSLMGTNLTDYLIEANRVLRKDGILKIAEVESRFDDVDDFIKSLASYGFVNTWKDLSHNLFYFMDFKKEEDITKKRNKLPPLTLKSCLYKKR